MILDLNRRTLVHAGRVLRPSPRQWAIASYLAAHPGWVRSRDDILAVVDPEVTVEYRTVDSTIKHLRRAMRAAFGAPDWILTHYGEGYYWREEPGLAERSLAARRAELQDQPAPRPGDYLTY